MRYAGVEEVEEVMLILRKISVGMFSFLCFVVLAVLVASTPVLAEGGIELHPAFLDFGRVKAGGNMLGKIVVENRTGEQVEGIPIP